MRLIAVALPLALALAVGPAPAQDGRQLYIEGCVSCHGANGEGVVPSGQPAGAGGIQGAGPPLRGVGAMAAHFYLSTGRMPLDDPDEQPERGEPAYSDEEIGALVAYVASLGDGPEIPEPDAASGDVARGMKLFGDYCMGCHQIVGEGGVVVGAVAPELDDATATQIAEAVRIGPYVMPAFGEGTIDEQELNDLIRYIEYVRDPRDEGGWAIGHLGPIPEGLAAWLLGAAALVAVAVAIGERLR